VQLESRLGSRRFAALSAELLLLSQAATLGLSAAAAAASPRGWGRRLHTSHCAVGLSGLLFSYKVLLTWRQPGASTLWGMQLPTRHLAWAELVLSSVLNPRASFLGHLGGILAGLLHVTVIAPAAPVMAAAARRGVLRLRLALRPGAARFATTTAPSPRRTADSTSNQQRRRAPHQARGAAAPHDEPTTPAPVAGAPHAPALSADELRARRLQRFG
jgi:Rhomboid family